MIKFQTLYVNGIISKRKAVWLAFCTGHMRLKEVWQSLAWPFNLFSFYVEFSMGGIHMMIPLTPLIGVPQSTRNTTLVWWCRTQGCISHIYTHMAAYVQVMNSDDPLFSARVLLIRAWWLWPYYHHSSSCETLTTTVPLIWYRSFNFGILYWADEFKRSFIWTFEFFMSNFLWAAFIWWYPWHLL